MQVEVFHADDEELKDSVCIKICIIDKESSLPRHPGSKTPSSNK